MIARTAHTFCSKIDWSSTSQPCISWVSNNHHQGSNRDVNNASDVYLFVVNTLTLSDTDPFRIVLKFHQFHSSIIFVWFTFILPSSSHHQENSSAIITIRVLQLIWEREKLSSLLCHYIVITCHKITPTTTTHWFRLSHTLHISVVLC